MPEKLADIGMIGPTDVQGNCHGGAGSAKAAVQQVQVRAMVPSHQPASGIDLLHEAEGKSCERVAGRDRVVVAPQHFQKARLLAAVCTAQ